MNPVREQFVLRSHCLPYRPLKYISRRECRKKVNFFFCLCLTSHQQLRSYGDGEKRLIFINLFSPSPYDLSCWWDVKHTQKKKKKKKKKKRLIFITKTKDIVYLS